MSAATPAAGSTVPVDATLTLTFDRPMDAASVGDALRFEPSLASGHRVTASPDGKTITVLPGLPLQPSTSYRLVLASAAKDAGGRPLRSDFTLSFSTAAPRSIACSRPAVSPDGLSIAWTEGHPSEQGVWNAYVAPADGSARPRLVAGSIWPASEVTWYPQAEALLVVIAAPADGGSLRPALARASVTAAGAAPSTSPAVPQPLPLNSDLASPSRLQARFSPDGTLLAVQNDMYMADAHSDYLRQLGIARADGTGWTEAGNLLLGWSSDGSGMFYLDMPGIGEAHSFDYRVYRYDVAAGTSSRVDSVGTIHNFGRADRSADGQWFVFHTWQAEEFSTGTGLTIERMPRDIWLVDTGFRQLTRLSSGQGHNADVVFDTLGGLLFASDRGTGDWDVWRIPAFASTPSMVRNLTARPGYDGAPAPALAGTRVAFLSDASGTREIWTVADDGSGWRLISGR